MEKSILIARYRQRIANLKSWLDCFEDEKNEETNQQVIECRAEINIYELVINDLLK